MGENSHVLSSATQGQQLESIVEAADSLILLTMCRIRVRLVLQGFCLNLKLEGSLF